MDIDISEYYDELHRLLAETPTADSYSTLYRVLNRLCIEATPYEGVDYSGLFSRLRGICRHVPGARFKELDTVRRIGWRYLQGKENAPIRIEEYRHDVAEVALFASHMGTRPLPDDFKKILEADFRRRVHHDFFAQKVRALVTAVDAEAGCFRCIERENGPELMVLVPHLQRTLQTLQEGDEVNILHPKRCDTPTKDEEVWTASLVILDPDYLIDVSALTAVYRPYGAEAENYLLALLDPTARDTRPIMLGNAANDFMDDIVNTPPAGDSPEAREKLYQRSLQRHFRNYLLAYACLADPLTADYFSDLKTTFQHIADTAYHQFPAEPVKMPLKGILLEPSFLCEALGLRGRFDVLSADHKVLLELKGGKAEEYGRLRPRLPHVLQMSLYGNILYYNCNLTYKEVRSFLFYSRYPILFDERSSAQTVRDCLELRNEIVHMERRLRRGEVEEVLQHLTPEHLNTAQQSGRFWQQYLLPSIRAVTLPLEQASPLERNYFRHFLTFIEREKYLSKTTDCRPDSHRGLASAWTCDLESRKAAGDILVDLTLVDTAGDDGIETLTFALPPQEEERVPNFSVGEMVQCYEREGNHDNVTTQRLLRGYLEQLTADRVVLRLAYKQRGDCSLSFATHYAIEHDGSDMVSHLALRSLFRLLTATPRRRALLLGQRAPEVDRTVTLRGSYPPAVTPIVTAARQASDFFLLVGPPGTGKTSVALRAMVEEFLLNYAAGERTVGLLLSAYTNRAVDEICEMLEGLAAEYVRLGNAPTCGEAYRPHLVENLLGDCKNRREVRARLTEIPLLVGTVTTLSAHTEIFRLRPYEAIIDEASQVLEPQVMGLLAAKGPDGHSALRKFVMIGDHKQLPAVVLLPDSQTRVDDADLRAIGLTDLRNSLFQRLHQQCVATGRNDVVAMLDHQGRMHSDICRFVNAEFYEHRLFPVPLAHQEGPLALRGARGPLEQFVAATRMGFVNVVPSSLPSNNKANTEEAEMVAALVDALCRLYARNGEVLSVATQVGIIVPFRNQIGCVRTALRRRGVAQADAVTIDTVECYQGSQRDFILFSTTISQPYQLRILSCEQKVGSVRVDRKLNVALTRARRQFFMVGNGPLLARSGVYQRLMAGCTQAEADTLQEE